MKEMFKKLFTTLSLISITSAVFATFSSPQVSAVDVNGTCNYFLGLTSWNCGIKDVDGEEALKTNAWRIVANVANDITVIAAYLVLGYVIYGGYRYTFSEGDPNKVATGKKTLVQAFIGLAIVMSANLIMNTMRYALVGNSGNLLCDVTDGANNTIKVECATDTGTMLTQAIQWFIAVIGIVAAVFVVYGGILYITSSGDSNKLQKAKNMITYALIGLAIVGLAEVITAFVSNMIDEANKKALLPSTSQDILATTENSIKNISFMKGKI